MIRSSIGLIVLAALGAATGSTHAMTLTTGDANIVELLAQSNDIVVGKIEAVTDGIDDHGVPYTEVTLEISESIRGNRAGAYKFRQFGLLAPRLTADGRRKMMASPTGFPKYTRGEEVALFLRPSAAWTGFRMPAGVTGGKFTIDAGRVENGRGNAGLFENVDVDRGVVTERDKRLLATASGPLNPDAFLSFVRRAVREHWTETERMIRTDRPRGPRIPPPSDVRDAHAQTPAEPPAAAGQKTAPRKPDESIAPQRSRQ
jgi:hypothetical protein